MAPGQQIPMPNIVGVRFKPGGKIYSFLCNNFILRHRDCIVVETEAGPDIAWVATTPKETPLDTTNESLASVLRMATADDIRTKALNVERENEALKVCSVAVRRRKLPMKLIDAQCTLDASQITINFAAESRVDFRELVRDVASTIHTRVIFHQVGARDYAKAIGFYGACGQALCCARFLNTLDPISIRMAKDQSLVLNPEKFTGVCGKLMCCLRFEHDTYREVPEMPAVGEVIQTHRGQGLVIETNTLTQMITARFADDNIYEFSLQELNGTHCEGRCESCCKGHQADSEEDNGDPMDLVTSSE